MGLDNGIYARMKRNKEKIAPFGDEWANDGEIEILYWRKCWNVRDIIVNVLLKQGFDESDIDNRTVRLSLDDFEKIIEALEGYYCKERWDVAYNDGDTIWEWDEIEGAFKAHLKDAKEALEVLRAMEEDDYELGFYDSY